LPVGCFDGILTNSSPFPSPLFVKRAVTPLSCLSFPLKVSRVRQFCRVFAFFISMHLDNVSPYPTSSSPPQRLVNWTIHAQTSNCVSTLFLTNRIKELISQFGISTIFLFSLEVMVSSCYFLKPNFCSSTNFFPKETPLC